MKKILVPFLTTSNYTAQYRISLMLVIIYNHIANANLIQLEKVIQ